MSEKRPIQNPGVEYHTPPPDISIQPESPDFCETPDIAPISAEHEPFPFWMYIICGVALFFAGSSFTGFEYFGRDLLDQGPGGPAMVSTGNTGAEVALSPAEVGKKLYGQNCANCHVASGMGQPGSYPPLAGSEWVIGSKDRLSLILLAGVSGPLSVKGDSYGTQVMPAWASNFTDEKIADIMTYIRGSWGNTADPVKPDEVAAARAKYSSSLTTPYSQSQLMQISPK